MMTKKQQWLSPLNKHLKSMPVVGKGRVPEKSGRRGGIGMPDVHDLEGLLNNERKKKLSRLLRGCQQL